MTMQLDHDQLHRLLDTLRESDIQEFRLEGDDFRLEVRRNIPGQAVMAPVMPVPAAVPAPAPVVDSSASAGSPPPAAASSRSDLLEITAPMVGTFYRAPAPGEPPFAEVGSRIKVGQTVCILEAMKLETILTGIDEEEELLPLAMKLKLPREPAGSLRRAPPWQ